MNFIEIAGKINTSHIPTPSRGQKSWTVKQRQLVSDVKTYHKIQHLLSRVHVVRVFRFLINSGRKETTGTESPKASMITVS